MMIREWTLVVGVALAPGCLERSKEEASDSGASSGFPTADDTDSVEPSLVVSSRMLRFSAVPVGEASMQALTLSNTGDDDVQLYEVSFDGPTSFQMGSVAVTRLAPGASTSIEVTFAPESTEEQQGRLFIESSDPLQAEVRVDVLGDGAGAVLAGPAELELGPTALGCVDSAAVVMTNAGTEPLTVTGASVAAPFSVGTADLPMELAPDEEARLIVWYTPTSPDQPTSSLLVVASDAGDVTVPLSAAVAEVDTTTESFVAMGPAADVLLTVDTSPSMAPQVNSIVAALPALTAALDDRGADWRVSVVAEDDGCVTGPDLFIDDSFSASDVRAAAATMIGVTGGYGSNQERAFMLMEAALDAAASGGCNVGLLRDPATLQLVAVSDEEERSVQATPHYVSTFQGMKDNPSDVAMHAIGPCTAGADTQRYEDAAVATGGQVYSICDTMEASFDALARSFTLSGPTVYTLTDPAVPETLHVRVDGVSRSGWTYDATTQVVAFDPAASPAAGEDVDITYVPDSCP